MRWIALLAIVLVAGVAAAFAAPWGMHGGMRGYAHHAEMAQILETGDYQDLVEYREEIGWNMMPWIEDADDFALMQERYAGRYGLGGMGQCPMWS